jgi:hypothetical protein
MEQVNYCNCCLVYIPMFCVRLLESMCPSASGNITTSHCISFVDYLTAPAFLG